MLSYQIRPATAEDVEFLADVVVQATRAQHRLPDEFDEEQWRAGFGEWTLDELHGAIPDSVTSVIEVCNRRVGRLRVVRTAERIELCGIQLLPDIQRQGIGTAIIEGLQAEAVVACIPLDLDVEKDNPDARRLYEHLGFTQLGETAEEYKLRWNPAPLLADGVT